ncbi:MAG: metal ABC transporter permease [Chlamydiota bacterium]
MIYLSANPYTGENFFGFFSVLLQRIYAFFIGTSSGGVVSDEIQCIVLILLALSLAFLGSFLVVKQMTMLANALSHTLLVGIVIAFLILHRLLGDVFFLESFSSMKILWVAALITGLITTLCTELLTHKFRVQEDASIGLVFTTLFALGIFLVTVFTRNMHIGVEAIMGNIDVLHVDDIQLAGIFTLVTLCFYLVFFRGFFVSAFDPIFSKTLGFPVRRLDYLLMVLTAGGAIASFRAVGVLLFLALLVGPVLIARLYTHNLKKVILFSFLISSSCSLFSVALSRHILTVFHKPISTSGLIVSCLFSLYLLALWSSKKTKYLKLS